MTRAGTSTKNGFVSLCREIFSRFVEQHFPTVINSAVGALASPVGVRTVNAPPHGDCPPVNRPSLSSQPSRVVDGIGRFVNSTVVIFDFTVEPDRTVATSKCRGTARYR